MDERYSVLIVLQDNLPEVFSAENVHPLEQLVARYQAILSHIA